MKLSRLIEQAQIAMEEYGDLEINALYLPGDNWMRIEDYESVITHDEAENELLLLIG